MQNWDCSQTDNEEEEESWQEGDHMAEQWEEEQQKKDRSSLKLDAMQKVLELVVNERMSQGKRGERLQRKEESRNEGKARYRYGGRHGRNEKMESSEPERDGPMLEEVG